MVQTKRAPTDEVTTKPTIAPSAPSSRIATIDWMRGLVMVLMIIDHASMAFDGTHISKDSAMYADAATMALPGAEFFTRWMTALCAPTFVFLAGTSLAISIERRVAKGIDPWEIDKGILTRGAIIALFDITLISFGSGRWNIGVLMAIGLSMICMTVLRRLPSWLLLALGIGWMFLGELVTAMVWHPPGSSSKIAAFFVATYGSDALAIKYPLLPWLAIMMVGWVFGRYATDFNVKKQGLSPKAIMTIAGVVGLVTFVIVRYHAGYGDMFLHRSDHSWQQWLHISKYPPSLTYYALELGILCLALVVLRTLEPRIGVRPNGVFLVFGQTAMFYYLVHRLAMEIPATYFGLRGIGNLTTTYLVSVAMLIILYPLCRWYRTLKQKHPQSFLKYI
ncbi:MAG TPA: heparan-alpha-glucosaminide N-acetyltransferase domain-containing protein [Pyrinomonadaceae bacterium]|nr:heparan-alpha-glucosaminide N-acetyltransferase domain-containing protein [Pyrinomonadaceae bacterium]